MSSEFYVLRRFLTRCSLFSWHRVTAFSFGLLLLVSTQAGAERPVSEYELKAAFIYNFTRFTEWPNTAFDDENPSFNICVYGEDPFGDAFSSFLDKKAAGRSIVYRRIPRGESSAGCQILYISGSESAQQRQVLAQLAAAPVLTVSDMKDFASQGGMVGLVRKDRKIGIQINLSSVHSAGLRVSAKLLSVAEVVGEEER